MFYIFFMWNGCTCYTSLSQINRFSYTPHLNPLETINFYAQFDTITTKPSPFAFSCLLGFGGFVNYILTWELLSHPCVVLINKCNLSLRLRFFCYFKQNLLLQTVAMTFHYKSSRLQSFIAYFDASANNRTSWTTGGKVVTRRSIRCLQSWHLCFGKVVYSISTTITQHNWLYITRSTFRKFGGKKAQWREHCRNRSRTIQF